MRILRFAFFLILLTSAALSAQTSPPPAKSDKPNSVTKEESHLSPAEADELFKSLDEIMKFASDDSGLPIRAPIKRELGNRDQVVQYIQQKMEDDEDTKRFERTELVLKKFGMLPVDFQLKPFLLKLLREQVAGFYDAKTKTMHLLDWLPADAQRPVMAHELTHALQDQTVPLETWTGELTDSAKKAADPINAEIENDEDSTARTALVEGQGTAVMVDYMLQPVGRSVENSPELVNAMKDSMSSTEGMTVLASAPVLLRESLTFPYREGLGFVQALLKAGGKKRAFADALKDPPHNTHQILHPQDYLDKKPTPVMHMPDLTAALGDKYEKYDVGSIGEFDLEILFKQFSDERSARELSPEWKGGMYYAAFRKIEKKSSADAKGAPASPAELAVLYVSHWSSPENARKFAKAYGQTVAKRYAAATSTACSAIADCLTWNPSNPGGNPGGNSATDPVTVQTLGDTVIAIESFDANTAAGLRKLIVASSGAPTQKSGTEVSAGNLSTRVAAPYFAAQRALLQR